MIFKRNASDFMTESVIVANTHSTFSQVMEFFDTYKMQHLPVLQGTELVGIVSMKDVLAYILAQLKKEESINFEDLNSDFQIEKVMTASPVTVSPDSSQKKVLELLSEGKFQALPVVENGKIKGIISNKDIARIYYYDATHLIP